MGQPLAFISYRRTDASLASQALHVQLRERFGPSRVFMDVGSIAVGDRWPDRLRRAVDSATVVLAARDAKVKIAAIMESLGLKAS